VKGNGLPVAHVRIAGMDSEGPASVVPPTGIVYVVPRGENQNTNVRALQMTTHKMSV
jgi:hypothetical protein